MCLQSHLFFTTLEHSLITLRLSERVLAHFSIFILFTLFTILSHGGLLSQLLYKLSQLSHGGLLLPEGEPDALLAAGAGGHAHGVLVARLLQTGPQGVVYAC